MVTSYPELTSLLNCVPPEAKPAHPIALLSGVQDHRDAWRYGIAQRTESAIHTSRTLFPDYVRQVEQRLRKDPDPKNARAILGEIRALGSLATVFGAKVTPQRSGADFLVRHTSGDLLFEVTTLLGATRNTTVAGPHQELDKMTIQEIASAPFGYASEKRPLDTVQGNAVSHIAARKQEETQADETRASVLWLDFNDPTTFPLSIGTDQTQPLIGGGRELVSGVIWWANYGRKGDVVFDSWPPQTSLGVRSYKLEFDARLTKGSSFSAVVSSLGLDLVVHENHLSSRLDDGIRRDLISLPGIRFELCWLDWPCVGHLPYRVRKSQKESHALVANLSARAEAENRPLKSTGRIRSSFDCISSNVARIFRTFLA